MALPMDFYLRSAFGIAQALPWLGVCLVCLTACSNKVPAFFQGYIEGEFVYVASPFGGRLDHLCVYRGDLIPQGALLFVLDEAPERAARDEARRRVDEAGAELSDALEGRRPTEIEAIEAQLKQAQAALALSKLELNRQNQLLQADVTSRREFDTAQATHDADRQRVAELTAVLQTAHLGSRVGEVNAARQNLLAQEAALERAEWNLSQKSQFSPEAGLIFDTLYLEGEWVPPGSAVIVLLPPDNIKVRTFIPQDLIGRIYIGTPALIHIDGVKAPVPAKVSFLSPQAEFTPPVIFSREMREKFVFLIELSLAAEEAATLHPGQPVDVELPSVHGH
jgi:HlyD family secretion protein